MLRHAAAPGVGLLVVGWLLGCGPDRASSEAGEGGSGTSTTTSTSTDGGNTTTSAGTTLPTSSATASGSTDDDDTSQANECQLDFDDCPSGTACCQFSFADPTTCEPVPAGGCGGDVDCPAGLECFTGSTHCGIGECVRPQGDTTEGSGSDSTAGSSTDEGSGTDEGTSTG